MKYDFGPISQTTDSGSALLLNRHPVRMAGALAPLASMEGTEAESLTFSAHSGLGGKIVTLGLSQRLRVVGWGGRADLGARRGQARPGGPEQTGKGAGGKGEAQT